MPEGPHVSRHVFQQDVPMDIRQDDIVGAHLEEGGVATCGFHAAGDAVPAGVAPGGSGGDRVDVDRKDLPRAHLGGEDAQDGGAAAHVQD